MSDQANKTSNKRGDALPTDGYAVEVDRKIKSRYATSDEALKAGLAIKRNYPVVQVTVFDAAERTRRPVELPAE